MTGYLILLISLASCSKESENSDTPEKPISTDVYINEVTFSKYFNGLHENKRSDALIKYFDYLKKKNEDINETRVVPNQSHISTNISTTTSNKAKNSLYAYTEEEKKMLDYKTYTPRFEIDVRERTHVIDWVLLANSFGLFKVISTETLTTNLRWITGLQHNGSRLHASGFLPVDWRESYATPYFTKQVGFVNVYGTLEMTLISWNKSESGGIAMNAKDWAEGQEPW